MTPNLQEIAVRLDDAARFARSVDQLVEPLSIDESYEVQAFSLARRYERGERRVGVKIGFTSRAKMVQMGLDEMIWGRLTDAMLIEDGGVSIYLGLCIPGSNRKSPSCSRRHCREE